MKNSFIKIQLIIFFSVYLNSLSAQVSVRIFTASKPESVMFCVSSGEYSLAADSNEIIRLVKDELVLVARFNDMLAVKTRNSKVFVTDSITIEAEDPESTFSVRLDGEKNARQLYSGDLRLKADLATIVLINNCDQDAYLAGVVRAEGGSGRHREYYKTQAVIARTYLYKYKAKHVHDGYNLCDNTHCQVFNGIITDTIITNAVANTGESIIMTQDSTLIISAFHSNCGGETASSEDVWLTGVPYLRKVIDPYCSSSRNATWEKIISADDWTAAIGKLSHTGESLYPGSAIFRQDTRISHYKTGGLIIPFVDLRNELGLRSAFFSITPSDENLILKGRGYGHGVGLCQEGAMSMAMKGFLFADIIKFYYTGVIIADVSVSKPDVFVR